MEIRPIFSALLRNLSAPILVALQVAISLAILANALHIVNVRQAVAVRPSGISDESTVFHIESYPLKEHAFNAVIARQKSEAETLRAIPGVHSVAQTNQMPMTRNGRNSGVAADRKQIKAATNAANYFTADSLIATLGLKLTQGRDFRPDDVLETDTRVVDATPKVVIITEALAKLLYPGAASVIGKPMYYGVGDGAEEVRIIGVVERLLNIDAGRLSGEYSTILPMRTENQLTKYAVRTAPGQIDRVMQEAEAALRKLASEPLIVASIKVEKDRSVRFQNDVALAWMLVAVSVLLLLITGSGIVGMTTLWVAQRRKQIGVRRALGARKADILRYFVTENIIITSGGIGCGLLLALGLNHILVSQLEMTKLPLHYLAIGAAVFWLLGILAVVGPALRAAGISPAIATRSA
jgi:putative ABC transport system permease protein